MARIVLTDASSLIGLARVDGLIWLAALFARLHASDFRISTAVIETILARVGEK
jgi:predicted nucleic acid-binding protein